MRTTPIQTAFTAGELSPEMLGRVDLSIYAQGCSTLENFTPLVQGPIKKRPGTKFIRSSSASFLTSFQFNAKEAYVLEFGRYKCWFSTNGQALIDNTTTFTSVYAQSTNTRYVGITGANTYAVNDRIQINSVSGHPEWTGVTGLVLARSATFLYVQLDTYAPTSGTYGTLEVSRFYSVATPWKLSLDFETYLLNVVPSQNVTPYALLKLSNYGDIPAQSYVFGTISGVVGATQLNGPRWAFYRQTIGPDQGLFLMDASTLQPIPFSALSAYVSGGTLLIERDCSTPWELGDAYGIRFAQSNDILYCACALTPPQIMVRTTPTTFTLTPIELDGGPFVDLDPDNSITLNTSATSGSVTLTTSSGVFSGNDVGRLVFAQIPRISSIKPWQPGVAINAGDFRRSDGKTYAALNTATTGDATPVHTDGAEFDGATGVQWQYRDPGFGWAKITSVSSTTVAIATVQSYLPDAIVFGVGSTTKWALGEFCPQLGYPDHVTFFRERLCFARSKDQKVWFSVSGDYQSFRSKNDSGEVVTDMAISTQIQSDKSNPIQWLAPTQSLLVGTLGSEFYIQENNQNNAFGPDNFTTKKITDNGGRFVNPVRVNNETLYVQSAGRQLVGAKYSIDDASYASRDASIFASHMIPKGDSIVQMDNVRYPQPIVWVVTLSGSVLAMTISREQEVAGWSRIKLGGTNVLVKSLTTIPADSQDRDEVWFLVERTLNGKRLKTIERLEADYDTGDTSANAWYSDCGASAESITPFSAVLGLWHLEGETVSVLADGAIHPPQVVEDGAISLVRPANKVVVGLPYTAKLVTLPLDKGQDEGTAQGKHKRIHHATIRFVNTLGGQYGMASDKLQPLEFRTTDTPLGLPELFTGDIRVEATGGWGTLGKLWYINSDPTPTTLVAIMPEAVGNEH